MSSADTTRTGAPHLHESGVALGAVTAVVAFFALGVVSVLVPFGAVAEK